MMIDCVLCALVCSSLQWNCVVLSESSKSDDKDGSRKRGEHRLKVRTRIEMLAFCVGLCLSFSVKRGNVTNMKNT